MSGDTGSIGGAYTGPESSGGAAGQYPGAGRGGQAATHFGGADTPDFNAMLEALQSERESESREWGQRYSQLESQHQRTSQTLDKIRQVFAPNEGDAPSHTEQRIAQWESQLDHYMQAAIDAERRGQPIPLTTNLAIQLFQGKIEQERERETFAQELRELRRGLDQAKNPDTQVDNLAYQNLDTNVLQAMDILYGKSPSDVKSYQFQAVTKALGAEIKDLKRNDPELWAEIRRDPSRQKRMVEHFVKQTIPPKAREILLEDQIRREPMTTDELFSAFREADAIDDPKERQRIKSAIRTEIVGRRFGGQ
jgi:hypothetical protein